MFIVAVHQDKEKSILSICDKEIIGKVFEEGKRILKLDEKFYQGDERSEEEVVSLLKSAYILHFTGTHCVQIGIDHGLIDKDHIITVAGVPHAEVVQTLFSE